jgi:parallel beta-helix repeat protein
MDRKATRPNSDTRWRLALLVACVPALSSPSTTAYDLCGATIVADLELGHDLTCAGDGLIVGADGIRLDLGGHTVAGAGGGIGIVVTGRADISIAGGTVRNFATGVRIVNSTDVVIKGNEFRANGDGVDCQAGCVGNTIKENQFWDHSTRAIMLRGGSADNAIKENGFSGNRVGILMFGAVDSLVKENTISGSTLAGIRVNVLAAGNLVKENRVASNPAGIEFLVTPTGSATGNRLLENTIVTNICGVKGPTAGNTVNENVFVANDVNICG